MSQERFIKANEGDWQQLRAWLDGKEETEPTEIPALYRRVCQHLAMARARLYSPRLITELSELTLEGHHRLYQPRSQLFIRAAQFIAMTLPQSVRAHWRLVLLSAFLFWGSFFAMLIGIQMYPDMVFMVMDADQVSSFEEMYEPSGDYSRSSDDNVLMFGYYVFNNAGIGFRTFASGLLFGFGAVFTLLFNGLHIGAAAGHITHLGHIETFWGFVSGHAAFELTAIVLSGAAGMRLGFSLLTPGRLTRLEALRRGALAALPMVYGAGILFVLAAFIEGFWSPHRDIAVEIKYTVGIVMWILTIAYFLFSGRVVAESRTGNEGGRRGS